MQYANITISDVNWSQYAKYAMVRIESVDSGQLVISFLSLLHGFSVSIGPSPTQD